MAREAEAFYRRLAPLSAEKRKECYSVVMGWLRCKLSFALLRSAIMCVRGTRRMKREDCETDFLVEATAVAGCFTKHSFLVHVFSFSL